jgi:hypothetical protein
MDGMVADDGAIRVVADLPSFPFVKGISGAEVARREGWSHGRRSWPGGLAFFVYVLHGCCSRLDTRESSGLMMSCPGSSPTDFYQFEINRPVIFCCVFPSFCSQGAKWHLLNLWIEFYISVKMSRELCFLHTIPLLLSIILPCDIKLSRKQQTCCQSSLTSCLVVLPTEMASSVFLAV